MVMPRANRYCGGLLPRGHAGSCELSRTMREDSALRGRPKIAMQCSRTEIKQWRAAKFSAAVASFSARLAPRFFDIAKNWRNLAKAASQSPAGVLLRDE